MDFIKKGMIIDLGALVVIFCLLWIVLYYQRKGKTLKVRKIAALVGLEESIGRATEMGRPIVFATGFGGIRGENAAATFAAMNLLGWIQKMAAAYNTPVITCICGHELIPLVEETMMDACNAAGHPEAYHEENAKYLSSSQWPYVTGTLGIIQKYKPAVYVHAGYTYSESIIVAEAANYVGATSIAAAGGYGDLMVLALQFVACDYCMIADEVYAAGAYISESPSEKGSVSVSEVMKFISVIITVVGFFAYLADSNFILNLIKL